MKAVRALAVCIVLLLFGAAVAAVAAESVAPFTELFDTKEPLGHSLEVEALDSGESWRRVPTDVVDHVFRDDVVARNNLVTIVIRRGGAGAEVYSRRESPPKLRALIRPVGDGASSIERVSIAGNAEDAVTLNVAYGGAEATGFNIELGMGLPYIKVQQQGGAAAVRVESPCRFAALPDFFADDIVIDATTIPVDRSEQPSENFFLHLLDNGDAMLMTVWENSDQDVVANLSGQGPSRHIQSVDIAFGKTGSVWLALIEDRGIWHMRDIVREDLGRELALDWKTPFNAIWRVDWRRIGGLNDSWEMVVEKDDGTFTKPDLFKEVDDDWAGQRWWNKKEPRKRWNTVLGRYSYPAWFDKEYTPHLQPIKEVYNWSTGDGAYHPLPEERLWIGPAIIFPIDRTADTPIDKFTVVDVVRGTLGVGPCQYILDVEGQQAKFKGRPTCAVRESLNEIYSKGEQIVRQREVEQGLDDVLVFIQLIRSRIDEYVSFATEMESYLATVKIEHPEISDAIGKLEMCNDEVLQAYERRKEGIKSVPFAKELVERFRREMIAYKGEDASQRCEAITIEFVEIGDNQDELVAECRVGVKVLRQQAALLMQTEPRSAEIVRTVRERTRLALRQPVSYEGARH